MSLEIAERIGSRAWRVVGRGDKLALELRSEPVPQARRGSVTLCMRAVPLLSYLREYASGSLPYAYPPTPFTLGTNGVGVVETVGEDIYHLRPGMRVALSPHLTSDEIDAEPAQILMGLTALGDDRGMLSAWRNGTLAERVEMPATVLTPLAGLDAIPDERIAALGKFAIPFGGLLRARLRAGETLVVNGASGYFGSAAVLLGVALGAARVIAFARDRAALESLTRAAGPRVAAVVASGDEECDAAAIRNAAGGKPDVALDIVGRATEASSTLATLRSLRRGGRLVLMGSMTVPLPLTYSDLLANDWEVIGNFMYPRDALRRLVRLLAAGSLSFDAVRVTTFTFEDLCAAMDAAAKMRGLDCTVVTFP